MVGELWLVLPGVENFPHPITEGCSESGDERVGETDKSNKGRVRETRLADPAPITAVSATAKSILVFRGFTFGHPQYIRLLPRATGRSRFGPPKPGPELPPGTPKA